MKKVTKCIIPAAGFGTRFLPATKALPKEMFPIIDKPVMQYLVEEAVNAGCTDIIIVTGRNKRAIEDHFDSNYELEKILERDGKMRSLEKVKSLNTIANIAYVRQPYPRGDGDAILRSKSFITEGEPFLVLFGDDLIDNDVSAATQLIETFYRKNAPIISTISVSDDEVSSYGIIESVESEKDVFSVKKFLEKPDAKDTKSRCGVIGKYVLSYDIFDYLEKASKKESGEIRLADAFEIMRKEKDIYGLKVKGTRFDTGSKIGFLKACINEGLKKDGMRDEIIEYIKSLKII